MNMNDLEKVNELAARWRKLDEMCQVHIDAIQPRLMLNKTHDVELEPKAARAVLEQLKRDVEAQLRNHGVTPTVTAEPDRRVPDLPGYSTAMARQTKVITG